MSCPRSSCQSTPASSEGPPPPGDGRPLPAARRVALTSPPRIKVAEGTLRGSGLGGRGAGYKGLGCRSSSIIILFFHFEG